MKRYLLDELRSSSYPTMIAPHRLSFTYICTIVSVLLILTRVEVGVYSFSFSTRISSLSSATNLQRQQQRPQQKHRSFHRIQHQPSFSSSCFPLTIVQSHAIDTDSSSSSSSSSSSNDATPASATAPATAGPVMQRTYCVIGVTKRNGALNEAVKQILQDQVNITISLQEATNLITIGAVWARMQSLNEQDLLSLYDDDNDSADDASSSSSISTSRALYADVQVRMQEDSIADKPKPQQKTGENLNEYVSRLQNQRYRRILSSSWIEAGTDVRVYPYPRRFPSCYDMTRLNNLLYEDTTFIVVDKPPMLPTQPDSSNYLECCPGCTLELLGPFTDITGQTLTNRPLLCHRVDACVGGCVVMSKNKNGQSVFHSLQRDRKIRKLYLAVTTHPVPLGMHLHWMYSSQTERGKSGRGPPCQLISLTPPESRRKARESWNRCLLEVVKCEPINIINKSNRYNPPLNVQHYQSTIRLVTGRKHQVRAQLASLGCPIICDTLYEPMSGLTLDRLNDDEEEILDKAIAACRVPTQPIGLQAHAILFGGIRVKAKTPWWG